MKISIKANMRRTYGKVEVEYGVEYEFDAQDRDHVIREQRRAFDIIEDTFYDFESNKLRSMGADIDVENEEVTAVSFVKNTNDGKTYYRVKSPNGTKYAKYGVPIYEEVLDAYGLLQWLGPNDMKLFPEGVTMTVNSGKRVVALKGFTYVVSET